MAVASHRLGSTRRLARATRSKHRRMSNVRLIARLDIKAPNLIKGVHLEGLRKIGDPQKFAQGYYAAGADEIIYMDIVASLYNRNSLSRHRPAHRRTGVHSDHRRRWHPLACGRRAGAALGRRQGGHQYRRGRAAGADHRGRDALRLAMHGAVDRGQAVGPRQAGRPIPTTAASTPVSTWWNGCERAVDLGAGEILLTSVDQRGDAARLRYRADARGVRRRSACR